MRKVKTATDKDGNKIKIGSMVEIYSYKGEPLKPGRKIKVIDIHHQGRDGTILHFEEPPNLEYMYHFTHVAANVKVVG